MSEQKSVYGHNLSEERGMPVPGIREGANQKGAPALVANARPKVVHAVDAHPELEETPMPPRNAPLSDEVPS